MHQTYTHLDNQADDVEQVDHRLDRQNPNSVTDHSKHTSDAVHGLIGPEMHEAPGLRAATDRIWETGRNNPARSPHAEPMMTQQMRTQPQNPFTHQTGSGIEKVEESGISDRTLIRGALAAGTTVAGGSLAVSALEHATIFGLYGANTAAAAIAAAPIAGGTLGYLAGKRFGHPVAGAAGGAAIGTIGTMMALNTAFGGTAVGIASGASIATGALPIAITGACVYGVYRGSKWLLGMRKNK